MKITHATVADLAAIVEIEETAPSPWSTAEVTAELAHPQSVQFVARAPGQPGITGWCCLRLITPEAELLKITVSPVHFRCGIGSRMLGQLEAICHQRQCTKLFLEVRQNNQVARMFYSKHGFKQIDTRPGYYHNPMDDGIILAKEIE